MHLSVLTWPAHNMLHTALVIHNQRSYALAVGTQLCWSGGWWPGREGKDVKSTNQIILHAHFQSWTLQNCKGYSFAHMHILLHLPHKYIKHATRVVIFLHHHAWIFQSSYHKNMFFPSRCITALSFQCLFDVFWPLFGHYDRRSETLKQFLLLYYEASSVPLCHKAIHQVSRTIWPGGAQSKKRAQKSLIAFSVVVLFVSSNCTNVSHVTVNVVMANWCSKATAITFYSTHTDLR